MTMTSTGLMGHCQACGRLQMVRGSDKLAKHGYRVKEGFFTGACPGEHHAPLQTERAYADFVIESMRAEAERLRQLAHDVREGRIKPKGVRGFYNASLKEYAELPYAEGTVHQKREAVSQMWRAYDARAVAVEKLAEDLAQLAQELHGQELVPVSEVRRPDPVRPGEQRVGPRNRVLTATHTIGVRVHWKDERGFNGWTGIGAWRKCPLVAEEQGEN